MIENIIIIFFEFVNMDLILDIFDIIDFISQFDTLDLKNTRFVAKRIMESLFKTIKKIFIAQL